MSAYDVTPEQIDQAATYLKKRGTDSCCAIQRYLKISWLNACHVRNELCKQGRLPSQLTTTPPEGK